MSRGTCGVRGEEACPIGHGTVLAMQNTKAPAAAEEPEGHNMRTKWLQKPYDSRRGYVRAKNVLFQLQQGDRKYKATFRLAAPAVRLRRRPPLARGAGGCPSTQRWSAAVGATRRGAAMRRLDRRRRMGYAAASGISACQGLGTAGAEKWGSFTAIVVILSLHGEAKCHS